MKIKNKKAISTLVATVLLILITVAAVGIIWGAIMPVITRTMEIGQACLNARVTINTESGYTCYNKNTKEVNIMISRGSEEFTLAGINLVLSGEGTSHSWNFQVGSSYADVKLYRGTYDVAFTEDEFPAPNEEHTYTINASDNDGLPITGLSPPETAKVAPIVKVGATLRTCSVSSSVTVPAECSAV